MFGYWFLLFTLMDINVWELPSFLSNNIITHAFIFNLFSPRMRFTRRWFFILLTFLHWTAIPKSGHFPEFQNPTLNCSVDIMVCIVSPRRCFGPKPSVPVNVTLFGNRLFADDQVKMRSLAWAPNLIWLVFLSKGEIWTQRQTHTGRMPWDIKVGIVVVHLQTKECQQSTRS